MAIRLFVLGLISVMGLGCASGQQEEPKEPSAAQVASCVRSFDPKLGEAVQAQPGPYRVRIDFATPPPDSLRLRWGIAECAGTTCSGWVERRNLLWLCRDSNVRDIQSWQ